MMLPLRLMTLILASRDLDADHAWQEHERRRAWNRRAIEAREARAPDRMAQERQRRREGHHERARLDREFVESLQAMAAAFRFDAQTHEKRRAMAEAAEYARRREVCAAKPERIRQRKTRKRRRRAKTGRR